MDEQITNRTIAYLLVGAIAVSLFGTFISLNKLDRLAPAGLGEITGMAANTSGRVQLTVSGFASFKVNDNVTFGSIQPQAVPINITTNIDNSAYGGNNCATTPGVCDGIELENDGNSPLNLSMNFTAGAGSLIGGTAPAFRFLVREGNHTGSLNSCTGDVHNTDWVNVTAGTTYLICNGTAGNGFVITNGQDRIVLEFNLTIPYDAVVAPNKQSLVTIWAW